MAELQRLTVEGFACAAWTILAEPGDEFAGLLRLTLGADQALQLLISRAKPVHLVGRIRDTPYADLAERRFGNLDATAKDALERWLPRLSKSAVENALKVASFANARLIHSEDESWPSQLADLGLATPAALWVRGSLESMTPGVAVVGSRAATPYGHWVTAELVGALAQQGLAVVSGGAFGIDTFAHQTANRLNQPNFAVMAGGVDSLYPSGNSELLHEVIERGAVIAELPPGSRPTRWRFLQRNRLIAALAKATVVVEAGYRSGAINTANHALALNRPLGAVPGPINQVSSAGCHRLIRDGSATLVSSDADLCELAGVSPASDTEYESLGSLELRVLDALSSRAKNFEALAKTAGVTAIELSIALGNLELSGRAERDTGDNWRRSLNL